MKRVLLKLSGEALAGEQKRGFDEATVTEVAKQIKTIVDEGLQVGIVIGGGNFWRGRTSEHIDRTLGLIKECGCKAGLVLNPATPLQVLAHVMDKLDIVLLMSVNPGFGGQSFIPHTLTKLREARRLIDDYTARHGGDIWLEVDGGVKIDNIAAIAAAGADTFVAGSAIFNTPNYSETIAAFRQALATVGTPD